MKNLGEMAQKEAEIHRRIAEMGRLVVNESKAVVVDENILGTIVTVAKSFFRAQKPVDDRLDPERQIGMAFLNPTIERIDADGPVARGPWPPDGYPV